MTASRPFTVWLLALGALLACYAPFLRGMANQWSTDEDMGHGFAVPLVVLWVVWQQRQRLRTAAGPPSYWGIAILAAGAGLHAAAAIGAGLFAGSLAFLVSLAGAVVALGGYRLLRALAFPFLLSLFMLPKLAIVYNQTTLPLQLLASRIAAFSLTAAGVGVLREGNILQVHGHRIAVAEACNGIRYLLPLGFLSLVYGYLVVAKAWARVVLLLSVIPLAILVNALRVALAAARPALAIGAPHMILGAALFVLCLCGLGLVHWVSNRLARGVHA